MKNIVCFFLVCNIFISLAGQRNSDYGIFGGVSSYFGDINPSRIFYSPRPAAGIFYRYNLNLRQSLRASLFYGGIRGNDLDFNNDFQQARKDWFRSSIGELTGQFEFNFFKYSTMGKQWEFSPYLAAGVGAIYLATTTGNGNTGTSISSSSFQPVLPFSVGFKINIYKNLGLEAEYGFRKTFYDNFDGVKNKDFAKSTAIHNNDWYTFTGLALTWKIYSKLAGCPAFSDVDSKRKR